MVRVAECHGEDHLSFAEPFGEFFVGEEDVSDPEAADAHGGGLECHVLGCCADGLDVAQLMDLVCRCPFFFDVAAAFLPALGFAMLAQMIMNKTVAPFFFAGFFLVAYFGISTTGVAIFAAIIVVAMTVLGDKKKAEQPAAATEDPAIGSGFDEF